MRSPALNSARSIDGLRERISRGEPMSVESKPRVVLGPRVDLYKETYGSFVNDVYQLPKHRAIVYEMEGFIMPEHVMKYVSDLLKVAERHRPRAMIADPRRIRVLNDDFQRAVQTHFWPEIARLGVSKNPAIDPSGNLARSSVNRMVSEVGTTITTDRGDTLRIAILPSLEDCLEWAALP
jgi:hypothetical protein